MKKHIILVITILIFFAVGDVLARNTIHQYNINDLITKPEHKSRLDGVSFYFGDQQHSAVSNDFGEFRTNKKTNAFNKSDLQACQWVMMSALLQLHSRAQSLGANAVINIKSNYKDKVVSSETEFTCGAGATMAGVALIGTIVTLK